MCGTSAGGPTVSKGGDPIFPASVSLSSGLSAARKEQNARLCLKPGMAGLGMFSSEQKPCVGFSLEGKGRL